MKKLYPKLKTGLFLLSYLGLVLSAFSFQGKSGEVKPQPQANPCNSSTQYLYWTGEENDDFFNENNWRETNQIPTSPGQAGESNPVCLPGANKQPYTICPNVPDLSKDKKPSAGTLDPGKAIGMNLIISDAKVSATGAIVFGCAEKGLTLVNSTLDAQQGEISQGVVSLDGESTVHVGGEDFSSTVTFNFLDAASWVYLKQVNPQELQSQLTQFHLSHTSGTLGVNFRINQYYQKGAIIRPLDASFAPLQVFSEMDLQSASANVTEDVIHRGAAIPTGDNSVQSFVLKRGFMATFANNPDGTGKSKVYIASEEDMEVGALPAALQGNVSFIRVVPWNWVTKKGTGGIYPQLDAGWFYSWSATGVPTPNYDYVPMTWGSGAALPAGINQIIGKKTTTHVLGFNESDNCNGESGQFNNLCQPAVAVAYYEALMGTGVRLGSPAPREEGPTGWLLEFNRIAKQRDVRFDFVAVHWYDWGSGPANTPNASAQEIFNRFKAYLANVYRIYQLPIWITEFNANPNRSTATQEAFLKLALPYLESLDYVERYAYFQPNPNNANPANNPGKSDYLDDAGNLTVIGQLFLDHESTPSIPMATYAAPNNLEGMDQPFIQKPVNSLAFEAECGKYLGNQWDVLADETASNGQYIRGNTSKTGASTIAKQVHFEFDLTEGSQYRVWIRAKSIGAGSIRIGMDGNDLAQITPLTSGAFTWFQIPRFFDLGKGTHRLTLEFPNANILIDQVVITTGPTDLESFVQEFGACTPSAITWGLVKTDILDFYEAEMAQQGPGWEILAGAKAQGGLFSSPLDDQESVNPPTGSKGVLTFNVTVEEADEYELWAKVQGYEAEEYSLWVSVDGEPFRKWEGLGNELFEWYWKKVYHSYEGEQRKFSYYLTAGSHQIRLASSSGNVPIDRIAIASKGKLPESIDPNVILVKEKLEFEAEHATLLGTAFVVDCGTSSNGKQVNMRNINTNGIRFDQIVAQEAGTYVLNISYMSAVIRSFRLLVNGVAQGQKTVQSSGAWCFNNGVPGVYKVEVTLKEGLNSIDITPFIGDAPFIDKIKLEKAPFVGLSFEAELAEQIGANTLVTCGTSSNGQMINMLKATSNGVKFSGINVPFAGKYLVEVHYMSAVDRSIRYALNGAGFVTETFTDSGEWCSNGGVTAVKTYEMDLKMGNNTLEFRPTGTDAPFLDKIVIKETTDGQNLRVFDSPTAIQAEQKAREFRVYPNPVQAGNPITLEIPTLFDQPGAAQVQITDLTGKVIHSQVISDGSIEELGLTKSLARGMYIVLVQQGQIWQSKKLIVQ
ncbi:T9SS C-terminal target domain-containing protein [Algoriphagus lacus]|uniref:T9SS C-terminal target domain-containing protein n=1 Tax=Algoriphagus lacus TaxID=2056311 RepID=A0A418PTP1_9BACT|nr:glycosyl hydrolase [Algoriphagus lacus]RIW16450.1 T9SS C-terminal target domain-containing protein [Algoriphagus lacus]